MNADITIYDKNTGRIDRVVSCPESAIEHQYDRERFAHIEGKFDDDTFYIEDGSPVMMPPRPSLDHDFDTDVKQWRDRRNLEQLRALRRADIEAERIRRTVAPIAYDGKSLDANKTAQDNISAKLVELDQRIALGMDTPAEMLMWRDADNITHFFESQVALRDWLGGLAIAIATRGTEAYAWSWAKKTQLDGLGTREQILAMTL